MSLDKNNPYPGIVAGLGDLALSGGKVLISRLSQYSIILSVR